MFSLQSKINPLVAALYDSFQLFAWAYNKSLYAKEMKNGAIKINQYIWNSIYQDGLLCLIKKTRLMTAKFFRLSLCLLRSHR